jgi:release factor glutamine methyltransferase
LALALAAKYPESSVTAVDRSEEALALARENAEALGLASRVQFAISDWFSAVSPNAKFQLIVANPPYLTEDEMKEATPEVRDHEPVSALVSPVEGRADLEHIMTHAREFLASDGVLACETGIAQHLALLELARGRCFGRAESLRDLTGRERYILAFLKSG